MYYSQAIVEFPSVASWLSSLACDALFRKAKPVSPKTIAPVREVRFILAVFHATIINNLILTKQIETRVEEKQTLAESHQLGQRSDDDGQVTADVVHDE